jgi:dienelactone hydrolase
MTIFRCGAAVLISTLLLAQAHAADPRADFLKLIDRPRVPLAPEVKAIPTTNGLPEFHFTFAADAHQRVPGLLVKSDRFTGRRPVVIVLHGTGGTKEGVLPWLRELANRGFVAVAIDGRYHGERTRAGHGTAEYDEAIERAWQIGQEHPFFYDTVWDGMRLVDYLQTRDDVDATRIGLTGISKGGVETYLTAAVDPRIIVSVPCIGMQSFHWALTNNDWQGRIGTIQPAFDQIAAGEGVAKPDSAFVQTFYDRVTPGIYSEFDGPEMLKLTAPRPVLIINSDSDNHTPLPGVLECVAAGQAAYAAMDATNHFAVRIQKNTGHKVTPESEQAAFDWFVEWLKP